MQIIVFQKWHCLLFGIWYVFFLLTLNDKKYTKETRCCRFLFSQCPLLNDCNNCRIKIQHNLDQLNRAQSLFPQAFADNITVMYSDQVLSRVNWETSEYTYSV